MENHVFAWMMDIFFIFTLHILYSRLLGVKYRNKLILAAGWVGCFVLWNVGSYLFADNIFMSNINTCLVNILVICILYKGNLRTKIVLLFTVVIIGIISECIVIFLFMVTGIFVENFYSFKSDNDDMCVANALSKIICFIFIKIVSAISIDHKQIKIKLTDCLEIFAVPVGSVVICYMLWWNRKRDVDITQIITIGILLIINLVTYYVYQKIQANALERLNSELLMQQNEYFRIRYEEFQSQWEKIRRLRHDMRHNYVLEMSYLEKGEYQLLLSHYREKLGWLDNGKDVIDTGNIGIDSIINYKLEQARELNIEVNRKIEIGSAVMVDDIDLNILIGNLFDNAIEAVKELEEIHRNIDLRVKTDPTAFYMEIRNSYRGIRRLDDKGNYITGKRDRENHGIGLKVVRKIVHKYCGRIVIEDKDHIFEVKVMLYMKLDKNNI